MKIALLTATFSQFSGIDRVVQEQAKRLLQQGHEITIATLAATMKVPGVSVWVLGLPGNALLQRIYRLFFFFSVKKISATADRLKHFDQIISHQYPMNLIAQEAKKRYGVTYIYYNHGVAPPAVFRSLVEKLYVWLFTYLANQSVRDADRVISVSQYLAQTIEKETGKKSEVRYNTIDTDRFHPGIDGSRIRAKHRLENGPVILYVGRISPHKGVDLLIQAFNQVLEQIPDAQLLIVGKETFPRYSKKLSAIAKNNVYFVGSVPDAELPEYYAAANVYATASMWEGFDLPIAEAAAMHTPVVAFDIGPHKEIITKKDELVPAGNVQAFAQALITQLKK